MSWNKASAGVYDYYGHVAGVVCVGPVTHLMGVVCDGKLIWPGYVVWEENKTYGSGAIVAHGGRIWQCVLTHQSTKQNAPPSMYWQIFTVWLGDKSNPFSIYIPGYGTMFFYRGTLDQDVHPMGVLKYLGHPPCRGFAVVELVHWYLGRMRQAAPNIELIMRRWPDQQILTGDLGHEDKRGQMNPLAAAAELITNPASGLGLPASVIDTTSWVETANALMARSEDSFVSPILEQSTTIRDFLRHLTSYYDGWFRWDPSGKVIAGRFPHSEQITGTLQTVTKHDLVDELSFDAQTAEASFNEISVRYSDGARAWKDSCVKAIDRANWALTGAPRARTYDMPWINWAQQATTFANEMLKLNAWPSLSGTLTARAEKTDQIKPGSLFKISHEALGMEFVARCISKRWGSPDSGSVEIEWELERSAPVAQRLTAASHPIGQAPCEPEIPEEGQVQVWQVPACIAGVPCALGVLVHRRDMNTVGWNIWWQTDGEQQYSLLGTQQSCGVRGTISQDHGVWQPAVQTAWRKRQNNLATVCTYPNMHGLVDDQTVDIRGLGGTGYNLDGVKVTWVDVWTFSYQSPGPDETQTNDTGGVVTKNPYEDWSEGIRITPDASVPTDDWAKVEALLDSDDVADNKLLCVVFKANDPSQFEVMSVRRIYLNDGTYRLRVKRGCDGRQPMYLHAGDIAWVLWRKSLAVYKHPLFAAYQRTGATVNVKAQSINQFGMSELSETDPVQFTFANIFAPKVQWLGAEARLASETDFGPISWDTEYPPSTTFRLSFSASASDSYLAEIKLVGRMGANEVVLFSSRDRLAQKTVVATFTLPQPGCWRLFGIATDESGLVAQSEVSIGGSTRTLSIGEGLTALSPVVDPVGGPYKTYPKTVTLTSKTSGASIYYQITQLYGQPQAGQWTLYSGPIAVYSDKTLHAYAAAAGLSNSPIVSEHYYLDQSGRARPIGTEEP